MWKNKIELMKNEEEVKGGDKFDLIAKGLKNKERHIIGGGDFKFLWLCKLASKGEFPSSI